jgi:diguanylate cyclase (GGDEF)-like protein
LIGLVGYGRDITEQKGAEAALQRQTEELRKLADAVAHSKLEAERVRDMLVEAAAVVSDGFALFDPDDRLILCNDAFSNAYGGPPAELQGLHFADLQRRPAFRAKLKLDDASFEAWLDERVALHRAATGKPNEWERDGRWHLVQERRTKDGSTVLSRADITYLKRVEADLRNLAARDALTGLSNRRDFVEQANRLFGDGYRRGRPAALVLFDIDHFKRINDTYGHPAGDDVLRQVARVCAGLLRPTDLFARWGGEEFIQMLSNRDMAGAARIAERLRQALAEMKVISGAACIELTASFGLAIDDGTSGSLDDLIERADRALYRAKQAGRNRIEIAAQEPRNAAAAWR